MTARTRIALTAIAAVTTASLMSCTVALENDLREIDVSQIKDVKIFFTMMDGRFTYRANAI